MQIVVAVVAGIVTLAALFRMFFTDKEDFMETVEFWLTPDIVSAFKGQYWEDNWAELKMFVWLACGAAVGYGVYRLLA